MPSTRLIRRYTRGEWLVIVLVLALVLGSFRIRAYGRGAAFIIQATGMRGAAATVAGWESEPVTRMRVGPIPWRGGTLRAVAYQPYHAKGRGILLVPGVHADGIDEPRLVGFAREIAAQGHPVLTVELPDLKQYQVTARTTDMIEDAAAWTMRRPEYTGRDGRIGMMGISFGGGLTIAAAGRVAIRNGVAFAMSFGGHSDLPRTLHFLLTGIQPDGTTRAPHDYGVAIVTLNMADRLVPPAQAPPFREAILAFLDASRLELIDKTKAAAEFARAQALETALAEPARTYMGYVNARDVTRLGPLLLPRLGELGGDPALSPARSDPPSCPVFLLHGTDDNVVPAIESTLLADDLREHGRTVRVLLTPLITHAEVDKASTAAAVWHLISFWAELLDE